MSGQIDVGTHPECATKADYENEDAFADALGERRGEEGAETQGFVFADALIRANLLCLPEKVVNSSELPSC